MHSSVRVCLHGRQFERQKSCTWAVSRERQQAEAQTPIPPLLNMSSLSFSVENNDRLKPPSGNRAERSRSEASITVLIACTRESFLESICICDSRVYVFVSLDA
jgi:hypothetical protein